jgi:hypothetical protein
MGLGGAAAIAATAIRFAGLAGGRNHPIAWSVISFGVVMLFGAAILSLLWPRPDLPGGWCGSGAADQDQYAVTTVARNALVATLILGPCVVVAAAVLPRSFPLRLAVALGTSFVVAIPVLLAWFTVAFKIGCAGS